MGYSIERQSKRKEYDKTGIFKELCSSDQHLVAASFDDGNLIKMLLMEILSFWSVRLKCSLSKPQFEYDKTTVFTILLMQYHYWFFFMNVQTPIEMQEYGKHWFFNLCIPTTWNLQALVTWLSWAWDGNILPDMKTFMVITYFVTIG